MSIPTEGAPAPVITAPATPPVPPATPPAPADNPLERALSAERERSQGLDRQLAESRQREEATRLAGMDENARKIEEAKNAVRAELGTEHKTQLLSLRVRAEAGAFHDGSLAAGLLDLPIDATDDQIKVALNQLGVEKPYLLKSGTAPAPIPQGPNGATTSQQPPVSDGESFIRTLYKNRGQGEQLQV